MPPIKIKSESKVGMRHGQSPRYADVPYALANQQCIPVTAVTALFGAIPLYYLLILGVESGNFWTQSQPTKIKFAT